MFALYTIEVSSLLSVRLWRPSSRDDGGSGVGQHNDLPEPGRVYMSSRILADTKRHVDNNGVQWRRTLARDRGPENDQHNIVLG